MEINNNSGLIFKNNYKAKDSHPEYVGKINVDGKEKEISLWVKKNDKGHFFSASIKDPYVKEGKEQEAKKKGDLPF